MHVFFWEIEKAQPEICRKIKAEGKNETTILANRRKKYEKILNLK